ncbi:MAG: CotH kinase family protein [Bacteroidales bacterium]|nr:CotH kinase family protein [Bacteroidales bacterium]
MKRYLSILAIFLCLATSANARTYYRGDVNTDDLIDVSDITTLISHILGDNPEYFDAQCADLNGDGELNVSDVTELINLILIGREEKTGQDYVWDYSTFPEIHIEVSLNEWNRLLQAFDADKNTKEYIVARCTYRSNGDRTEIDPIGLRLRGNTSRRRPEAGNPGKMHNPKNTNWQHVHFGLKFDKFIDDKEHTILGVKKMNLKWLKDDPTYIREMYCYDLFRRFGVWTGCDDNYCRLYLHVEGDAKEVYYGVYEMIEPVDKAFLKRRKDLLENNKGFLWKGEGGVAGLNTINADIYFDDDKDHTYCLENNEDQFEAARAQLVDFMLKLNGKSDESLYKWINEVCDVDLLLKTYAVNVAVGMWDDYWNNANNYYIYFNSTDLYNYKFFFIPYDYDNTLGTSLNCGVQSDAGRQNPLNWGKKEHPLIQRLLAFPDFKAKYVGYLKELAADDGLFNFKASKERIQAWQNKIKDYIANDTGEDMTIYDEPASWGNHKEYRVLDEGSNNFFKVKTATINALP